MRKIPVFILVVAFLSLCAPAAEQFSSVVVFREPGFPSADSASPSAHQLELALPGARFASADQLASALKDPTSRLLVLAYGSAFPEQRWPEIYAFLQKGGNLLIVGGRPFTRSAHRDATGWRLRDYSVRFTRPLMIDQYQTTPGSEGMQFQTNPEIPLRLPRFGWQRGFSPVIRLSAVDLYHRGGAAGAQSDRKTTTSMKTGIFLMGMPW